MPHAFEFGKFYSLKNAIFNYIFVEYFMYTSDSVPYELVSVPFPGGGGG